MKIVICTCPEIPVPPIDYGGTEMQMDVLARQLKARGHQVVLLCGPNSTCPVDRIITSTSTMAAEWEYVKWLRDNPDYDCVIDTTAQHLPSQPQGLLNGSKTIALMYGDPHKRYPHNSVRNRAYLTKPFAEFCGCPNHPTTGMVVHSNPESIAARLMPGVGDYVLYMGTVRPEKGVHVAASACRQLGVPFVVAGPIQPRFMPYWESIKAGIDYRGSVGSSKWELYRYAAALAFPISWCDAGPLVSKEAMLVGTPVVACPNGGIVEDVLPDKTGWLCEQDQFTNALAATLTGRWDRTAIRQFALTRVDVKRYVDGIEQLCCRVSKGDSW